MYHTYRIGVNILPNDPFWVQLREAVHQRLAQLAVTLVPYDTDISAVGPKSHDRLVEELLSQDLDSLISCNIQSELTYRLLDAGLPIVHLHTRDLDHPLFVSPGDMWDIGCMIGEYIGSRLGGRGNVLMVGGLVDQTDDGHCRINGFHHAMQEYPDIRVWHIPCLWRYDQAYPHLFEAMQSIGKPIDAIFGLSDSLALAGRDACLKQGLIDSNTLIVGINGDPLALVAIAEGGMTATVDTFVADYGRDIADVAYKAACGEPLPAQAANSKRRLVTAQNVAEVAAQKLHAIAEIPNHLVGVNHQQEQQRLIQLETSLAINRQVGTILDRSELLPTLANLIRTNYGYDHVQVLFWSEATQSLKRDAPQNAVAPQDIPLANAAMLGHVVRSQELVCVPDTRRSHRFAPDANWPRTRTRVALPIRLGTAVIGVLDLHNEHLIHHDQAELLGLQVLADQLGIAMRNADLYSQAVESRAIAEKADRLKTQLLANVSHELRTPLNVILGYSQAALSSPEVAPHLHSSQLWRDLRHIYNSGEHLMRLINDLLDLSRAEIDELELFPETIDTNVFLRDLFDSFVAGAANTSSLCWQLDVPAHLPLIQADPLRLRQVFLNLLSNAAKFTTAGSVTLGAEIAPPHVHVWVRDTGSGIPLDQHHRIFEPFVSDALPGRRSEGIGLGLSITRRLVLLHRGNILVESQPGSGSTFHVFLPLPSLNGQLSTAPDPQSAQLLLLSQRKQVLPAIAELCERQGLAIRRVSLEDEPNALLADGMPAGIAWDLTHSGTNEWALIERLRCNPHFCQLPLILFDQLNSEAATGLTHILPKPASCKTILDMLESLRPNARPGPILIIDDDHAARELYVRLAAQALPNYVIQTAESGRVALEQVARELPSMVILDLSMPEIDGFGVLTELRARPATQHIPVLIVSSRVLSLDDIKRLDQTHVTYQPKHILSEDEAVETLQRTLYGTEQLSQQTSALVRRAVAYLQQHYVQPLTRHDIASVVGVSKNYLSEIFHQELGISPWEYLNRYRVYQSKLLLYSTSYSITSIATQVGFDDSSYFGRVFHKYVGLSPTEYRESVRTTNIPGPVPVAAYN